MTRLDTLKLTAEVVKAFRGTPYTVVIKRHPLDTRSDLSSFAKEAHVVLSQHSIHDIIPDASAVITANSGVGFEALLYKKAVYTSGHSDYHWVTHKIYNEADVKKMVQSDWQTDQAAIVKFVYFMLQHYFVHAYDPASVRSKIDMCVRRWREAPGQRASAG